MEGNKIQETQFLEQNLHRILLQKQAFQMELAELDASFNELEKSGDEVFKIIGQMMLKSDKKTMQKELSDKKKKFGDSLLLLEKQEETLLGNLKKLKKE